MDKRTDAILDTAIRVFLQFGVQRSSMNDLAKEAGISRPTLYKAFANKDDVLRALIRRHTENTIVEIRKSLDDTNGLGKQLDLIFDAMVLSGFDTIAHSPNAQDLRDGFNTAGKEEVDVSTQKYRRVIEDVLAPYSESIKKAGMETHELSLLIHRTAKASAVAATERGALIAELSVLKQACLTICQAY